MLLQQARLTRPQPSLVLVGRLAAVLYVLYAGWWAVFPAEGFSRRRWRPDILPALPPVRTLGTALLRLMRISREAPGGEELVRLPTQQQRDAPVVTGRPGPPPGLWGKAAASTGARDAAGATGVWGLPTMC